MSQQQNKRWVESAAPPSSSGTVPVESDKLDCYVLRLNCMSRVERAARGEVVDELVDTSTWRYAVIGVRSEPALERFVIAYPDEDTLRDLIAAPSIVAFGYASRADALKNIDRCVMTTTYVKRLLKAAGLDTNMTFLTECRVALRRLAGGFGVSRTSKIMRNLLHDGLAAALICFYSKEVLSRTIRAFISF